MWKVEIIEDSSQEVVYGNASEVNHRTAWEADITALGFDGAGYTTTWTDISGEPALQAVQEDRRKEYYKSFGSLEDQLDYIYHNGIEGWSTEIARIKALYPKP